MSPSGAELLRQIKSQIDEVDPSEVHELLDSGRGALNASSNGHSTVNGNGASYVVIDVRENEEFGSAHIPGAKHVPKSYLETRIESVVPDHDTRVILYCQSGNRSAWAARTLIEDLGYSKVSSMTGGITLWKDRGYEVEVPRTLTPEQRERYSRHLLMPEVGVEGQQKLLDAKVLLLGAGGLGSPSALSPGGGRSGDTGDCRRRRGRSLKPPAPGDPQHRACGRAQGRLRRGVDQGAKPRVNVVKYPVRIDASNIMQIIAGYDVIVDGVDNFPTRYLLNDATVRLQIPVVSASILGFDGQLSIFKPYEGPCYRCLFREPPPAGSLLHPAEANGVLGVLPGTMGLLQATEVVKLILGIGDPAIGRLLLYDALGATLTEVKVHRDPECPICSRDPSEISDEEMGVLSDYEAFCAAAG